jgi:hypothetical protein
MNPLYLSVAIGVLLGLVYALSPLTVWFAVAMIALLRWSGRGLPDAERRWIQWLLLAAIAARIAAIAGLFLATDHARVPFGSFFGDEEYFIKRSLWLRNVALGIPIHRADLIYAFDDYSYTSYLYVLALLQVLFGPAPYGLHLFGAAVYLAGAVLLFRVVRPSLGPVTAFGGLALLLFLPSLFAWSISALKEPLYFAIAAGTLAATVRAVREPRWKTRLALTIAIALAAVVMQTIREGGFAIAAGGIVGGLLLAALSLRPRIAWALIFVAPFVVMLAWRVPDVQIASWRAVRQVAKVHWGHIQTAGYTYKVLDDRFYRERSSIDSMDRGEVLRYLIRAGVAYVIVPLPWKIESRAAFSYVPEQMVWFLMLALAPLGIMSGTRRDPLVTWLLVAFALAAALPVALTSGNVGTLVRHRGLAVPFVAWLGAAGAAELAARLGRRSYPIDSAAVPSAAAKVERYALD